MGFGSSLKKAAKNLVKGKGNPLVDLATTTDELYRAPGEDTSKALPARYRASYERNVNRAAMGMTGNAAAGIFRKSKQEGYTDKEAATNAAWFGMAHGSVSQDVAMREANEKSDAEAAALAAQQDADNRKDRLQREVILRRRQRAERYGNKGGTVLTGPQIASNGIGGTPSFLGA